MGGWTYNTDDADAPTIGPRITGVATALTALSLTTLCLRLYVRGVIIKALGIDDWIIAVAWFCTAGFSVVTIIQTKWGLGLENFLDLPEMNIYNFGLIQYIGAPFYITSILGFKLSLLFSYLRFIPSGIYRKITIGVIVACSLFHLSFLLVQINLCQPASGQWDPAIRATAKCLDGVPVYTTMASITIVFDVAVMVVPFPVLLKSHIQSRRKVVLLGLFGLGMFITIIQIIRIQTVNKLVNYTDSAPLILWSTVENNLGVIVACVPTIAPLVKYFNERTSRGATTSSRNRRSGYPHNVGSRYAMHTWKSNRTRGGNGAEELDSGIDYTETGSVENHAKTNSTECIIESGITKKTEVTITRQ
ncbi:hypothetical protein B0T17DRAFT_54188 [Bombardia bombarda]|uniref:Rhodopsin domain-containing protein n=1 Tax=Bombardia bombarda TaxID=252184 RepID=A0AA39XM17_9PEZI|nr:hypothetical protein B0T17DRAFT_54188 [Bombardia bombarda]